MFTVIFCLFLISSIAIIEAQNDVNFMFIKGPSLNDYEYLSNENITSLLNNVHYFNNRPTVVYAYGFTQTYDSNATQRVIEAYIERNDHNILLIDWFKYSSGDYIYHAVPSAPKVAEVIAKTLLQMKDSGFNLDKFHLVGFSLGAQLCGMIGRSINTQSNGMFKISRITALDPAQPLFYGFWAFFFRIQPISKDDAIFVDVIHSDIATFGAPVATGTVDFWPNSGRDQPNCPPSVLDVTNKIYLCSHQRSCLLYAESVRNTNHKTFPAIACSSWQDFIDHKCNNGAGNAQAFMGIDADPRLTGDYFMQTNAVTPLSRGDFGMHYEVI